MCDIEIRTEGLAVVVFLFGMTIVFEKMCKFLKCCFQKIENNGMASARIIFGWGVLQ
jgi:hypothetical protein